MTIAQQLAAYAATANKSEAALPTPAEGGVQITGHLVWWNYKLAGDLPPDVVERMWRALATISERATITHPGHVDFVTKAQIAEIAAAALPSDEDKPRQCMEATQ